MNIAQALKQKNRLINEINRLKQVLNRDNSQKVKLSKDDEKAVFPPAEADHLTQCWDKLQTVRTELVQLKTKIMQASAPIAELLVRLAEVKDYISFLKSISIKEGEETQSFVHPVTSKYYVCFYDRKKIDSLIKEQEQQLYNIQDQIDEFNKITILPNN